MTRLFSMVTALFMASCSGPAAVSGDGNGAVVMKEPPRPRPLAGASEIELPDEKGRDAPSLDAAPGCDLEAGLPGDVSPKLDPEVLHQLGQERILQRKGPQALAILLEAERRLPKDAAILGNLATAMLQCRFYAEAIGRLDRALLLDPDNVNLAANLAQAYQIAGQIPEAVEAYRKAIVIAPDDPSLRNNLAVVLIVTGDLDGAEKQARKASQISPREVNSLINLGYVLARKRRLPDAEMILMRAIDLEPDNPDAHNQLGLVLAAQKRNAKAADHFQKALELDPEHSGAGENMKAMDEGFDFMGPWGGGH